MVNAELSETPLGVRLLPLLMAIVPLAVQLNTPAPVNSPPLMRISPLAFSVLPVLTVTLPVLLIVSRPVPVFTTPLLLIVKLPVPFAKEPIVMLALPNWVSTVPLLFTSIVPFMPGTLWVAICKSPPSVIVEPDCSVKLDVLGVITPLTTCPICNVPKSVTVLALRTKKLPPLPTTTAVGT